VPDDDLADADDAGLPHRFAKQRVGFVATFRGNQIVRRLEEARVDLVLAHEVDDVDGLRRVERGLLEVVIGEHDELAFLVLVALHDLAPRYGLAVGGADPLVFDRRHVFGV